MTSTPFFSVIIPTKNRSYRVANAIQSVLDQTFSDYEIIIVDNDQTQATFEVVNIFSDPRIRYFRTGDLSMADNWEYGRQQAQGEYLKYLPDRHLLKSWTLQRLYDIIQKENPAVISWTTEDIDDQDAQAVFFKLIHHKPGGTYSEIDTKDLLNKFLRQDRKRIFGFLPRGINSVCHHSLVQKIVSGPAGRLCHPAAPDFTMAFLQLAYIDTLIFLDEALNISCSGESNGREFRLKSGPTGTRFIQDTGEERFYNRVPVKAVTTQNMLFNDYLNIRALIPDRLEAYPLSLVNYFVLVYSDIRLYELVGVKTQDDLQAWEAALGEQPQDIQSVVRKEIKSYQRKYLVTLGNKIDFVWLQKARRYYKQIKGPRFGNVMEALKWRETISDR